MNWLFKKDPDIVVPLSFSSKLQKGTPIAIIQKIHVWKKERLLKKIYSFLILKWRPSENIVNEMAIEIFKREFFGTKYDLAEPLLDLMKWHCNQDWNFEFLTKSDEEKSDALEASTSLTRQRHWSGTSPQLNLNLGIRVTEICTLINPVIVKTPIRSIQYFIDIHSGFAFNEIRKSRHKYGNNLISYLYELMFLQQKISISLHSFLLSIHETEKSKGNTILIKNELDSIINAETIFTYLKSSVEKITALIGYTFELDKIDEKKTHSSKLKYLGAGIPNKIKETYYYQFIFEFISSNNLEELNKFRTGILHKKGIADLQPHNYAYKKESKFNMKDIYDIVHKQFTINSAVIIASLALLTDELVKLDPPKIKPFDIPFNKLISTLKGFNELKTKKAANNGYMQF